MSSSHNYYTSSSHSAAYPTETYSSYHKSYKARELPQEGVRYQHGSHFSRGQPIFYNPSTAPAPNYSSATRSFKYQDVPTSYNTAPPPSTYTHHVPSYSSSHSGHSGHSMPMYAPAPTVTYAAPIPVGYDHVERPLWVESSAARTREVPMMHANTTLPHHDRFDRRTHMVSGPSSGQRATREYRSTYTQTTGAPLSSGAGLGTGSSSLFGHNSRSISPVGYTGGYSQAHTAPRSLAGTPILGGQTSSTHSSKVTDHPDHFMITLDAPGLMARDIHVRLMPDRVLKISGEYYEEHETDVGSGRRIERNHRTFSKSYSLPPAADVANITSYIERGTVFVRIGKLPEAIKQPMLGASNAHTIGVTQSGY